MDMVNNLNSVNGDIDVVNIQLDNSDEDESNDKCTYVAEVADMSGEVEVHFQTPATDDMLPPLGKYTARSTVVPTWHNQQPQYTDWQCRLCLMDRKKLRRRSPAR